MDVGRKPLTDVGQFARRRGIERVGHNEPPW
jgi:hypothetical protein